MVSCSKLLFSTSRLTSAEASSSTPASGSAARLTRRQTGHPALVHGEDDHGVEEEACDQAGSRHAVDRGAGEIFKRSLIHIKAMATQVVDWFNQNRASKNVDQQRKASKMEKNLKDSKKRKEVLVSQDDMASNKHEAQNQDVTANDEKHVEAQIDQKVLKEDKITTDEKATKEDKAQKKGKAPMLEQKEKVPGKAKRNQHEDKAKQEGRTGKVGEGRRMGVIVNASQERGTRRNEKVEVDGKISKESNQVLKSAKAKEGASVTDIGKQPDLEKDLAGRRRLAAHINRGEKVTKESN